MRYRDKSFVHALQWAIGLEWYLLVTDPWRIAMSTDHPNGGSFLSYPEIIALLMEHSRRQEFLNRLPETIRARCTLADITREYSLSEIAIITRAAPARMLGLTQKGHLGPGADADITIYSRQDDIEAMFRLPRYVFSRGVMVIDDGEIRAVPQGETLLVRPPFDTETLPVIRDYMDRSSTVQFANFALDDHDLGDRVAVVPVTPR